MKQIYIIIWIIVDKSSNVVASHCTCMAGFGETCPPYKIAVVLFSCEFVLHGLCRKEITIPVRLIVWRTRWIPNSSKKISISPERYFIFYYFEERRIRQLPNWYEGAVLNLPSTNDGVEGTNAAIKGIRAYYQIASTSELINLHDITELIKSWSERRDPSDGWTVFAEVCKIDLREWTEPQCKVGTGKADGQ